MRIVVGTTFNSAVGALGARAEVAEYPAVLSTLGGASGLHLTYPYAPGPPLCPFPVPG